MLHKLIKYFSKKLDPVIGSTVTHFITHGCMAEIHKFDYIGVIKDIQYKDEHKFYKVEIIKNKEGYYMSDINLIRKTKLIASWYLIKKGNFYIVYD